MARNHGSKGHTRDRGETEWKAHVFSYKHEVERVKQINETFNVKTYSRDGLPPARPPKTSPNRATD